MGFWYEVAATPQIWEIGGKCPTAEYTLDAESGKVLVKNSMKTIIGVPASQSGYAEIVSDSGEGKLSVTFDVPVIGEQVAPYWILDTDYENYSVVYSCSSIKGLFKVESGWIMSRKPTLDSAVEEKVESAVKNAGLKRSEFKNKVQDC